MAKRLIKVFLLMGVFLLAWGGQAIALPYSGTPLAEGDDWYWDLQGAGTATILLENANYRNRNAFGIYSGSRYIQIFSGADEVGNQIALDFTDLANRVGSNSFGFYIETPSGKYLSDTSRNYDKTDHLYSLLAEDGTLLLGFEDLRGGGDGDFDDLVIALRQTPNTATAPVPEPATLLLIGSGLLGLASTRRKRSA